MYPKLEGRFPQVSGISFAFDAEKPAGNRVNAEYVKIGDEYLDQEKIYRMVTKAYIAKGKDGYDILSGCNQVIFRIQLKFKSKFNRNSVEIQSILGVLID